MVVGGEQEGTGEQPERHWDYLEDVQMCVGPKALTTTGLLKMPGTRLSGNAHGKGRPNTLISTDHVCMHNMYGTTTTTDSQ